ncbi:uncharacterized protein ZK673.1-like [Anneissia japonica]|uniref:uncharacterized protein ZK673.1-like n=1 Tax=Anneissia japonica TaxID=1529436 RepID=UPI0014256C02|nr:uncharacterized protein ZK673.1-like [Anneissia japonica]
MSRKLSAVLLTLVALCALLKSGVGERCEDTDPDCWQYADICEEPFVKDFVSNSCQETCGYCTGAPDEGTDANDLCSDNDPDCSSNPYICKMKSYRAYAEKNCRKTCQLCGPLA